MVCDTFLSLKRMAHLLQMRGWINKSFSHNHLYDMGNQ